MELNQQKQSVFLSLFLLLCNCQQKLRNKTTGHSPASLSFKCSEIWPRTPQKIASASVYKKQTHTHTKKIQEIVGSLAIGTFLKKFFKLDCVNFIALRKRNILETVFDHQ